MSSFAHILFALRRRISFRKGSTLDEQGRSLERERRVAISFIASFVARGVSVLTGFIAVPVMLSNLGEERYGVWLTLNSFLAYLSFADLGLGNGLLNAVSEAHGNDDNDSARRYISSAFYMLLVLAAIVGLLSAVVFPWIPWPAVFATKTGQAAAEVAPAVLVFLILFVVQMPLSIVQKVNLGYQEGYINSVFLAAGSVLGLGAVVLVAKLGLSLPWVVLAYTGTPIMAIGANWWVLFHRSSHREVRPDRREVCYDVAKRLIHIGGLFFVLQIAAAVAFASDAIVAAQVLGPEAVTQLGVPSRLFGLVLTGLSMAFVPLWPAYSEAITRGDVSWVMRTLSKSIKITLVVMIPAMTILFFLGNPILALWVGKEVQASPSLLAGLVVWTVFAAISNAIAMILNAARVIWFQVIEASCMAIVAITLKFILANYYGIEGIVWGMVIAYGALTLIPLVLYSMYFLPKHVSRQSGKTIGFRHSHDGTHAV